MASKISAKGKKFKFAAALLIIAAAVGGGAYWWFGRTPSMQYKSVPVVRTTLQSTIQATGTLNPVETVDVGTQISGKIDKLYFDYNSRVKAGELIALMESATQSAAVAQQEAQLASAKADVLDAEAALDVAKKDLRRTEELAKRDLIAKADVDADTSTWLRAKASLAAAKAKVMQYEAALEQSKITLGYTKIYSPIDGVVIAKNVEEGQTVAASYETPSIAEIARDLTQMQVEVDVDEADIGGVLEGQTAVFTVDTYPRDSFEGKVSQVRLSPESGSDDDVVTYTVVVKVQNPDGKLLPGMTANVSLILDKREDILIVPNSAFRFKPVDESKNVEVGPPPGGPGGHKSNVAEVSAPAVYLLDAKGRPSKAEVERGITDGQNTEVVSGLEEGQRVITGVILPREDE